MPSWQKLASVNGGRRLAAKNLQDALFAPDLQLPLPKATPVTSCIYFRVGCHGGHQIRIGFDLRKPSGFAVSFPHPTRSSSCRKWWLHERKTKKKCRKENNTCMADGGDEFCSLTAIYEQRRRMEPYWLIDRGTSVLTVLIHCLICTCRRHLPDNLFFLLIGSTSLINNSSLALGFLIYRGGAVLL